MERVTVGSSAVALEKFTVRSEGLLESTVQRMLPFDAVAAMVNTLPFGSPAHLAWPGPATAMGSGNTVTVIRALALPQLGLLWLVTVILKVAVPTFDRVTVGSSAVALEKVTPRSAGLLESTVHRILPFVAVAAIRKDLPSSSHFF